MQDIRISDYSYELPDERIAKYPLPERDHSKLLVYRKGEISEDTFFNLPAYLPSGSLMVFNNTRVIQARLHFRKASGALIEIFLLEPYTPADYEQMFQTRDRCSWLCLVGNSKKWKEGALVREFTTDNSRYTITATRLGEHGTSQLIQFEWNHQTFAQPQDDCYQRDARNLKQPSLSFADAKTLKQQSLSFADVIDAVGELPIPPYLNRDTEERDKTTYQTVYSKIKGSVAAPTAGLHFTQRVLDALDAHGIERKELTLHVGAGTFRPVKSELIAHHDMHTEYIAVRREVIEKLISHNGQAIAVGTTSVRTLESLYYMGLKTLQNPNITEEELHVSQWEPYVSEKVREEVSEEVREEVRKEVSRVEPSVLSSLQALLDWMDVRGLTILHSSTQIIIVPGYDYKIVQALVTNFHQPQSTLLLLVSAFVHGNWRAIYNYALAHDFRFLSYGDSSLLIP